MIKKSFDLLDDVVSVYDQTKTTIAGNMQLQTINGNTCLGAPLPQYFDIQTDVGLTPTFCFSSHIVQSNIVRIFSLTAEAVTSNLILYNFNVVTGEKTYVGRLNFSLPDTAATTTVFTGGVVLDNGTSNWRIFLTTTGSVLINGGLIMLNKVDLTDFAPLGGVTLNFATGDDQKAVYDLQDGTAIGVGHLMTQARGCFADPTDSYKIYVHNGLAATHQYWVFDPTVAPTYSTGAVTIDSATDVISHAGHTFVDNDPVVFTSITGGAGLTAGTVYFVRNSVASTSYQLSATTGGAAINITTNGSGNVGRAFGTTSSNFLHRTGNLPALTGTLLTANSESYAMPSTGTLAGEDCAAFATSTNLYHGKLSELTNGATTWPSLATANVSGAVNEVTAPTPLFARWCNTCDTFVFTSNTAKFYAKKLVNNHIDIEFGGLNTQYFETISFNPGEIEFGLNTVLTYFSVAGWSLALGGTTGQRGIVAVNHRSDAHFDYSYLITKVMDISGKIPLNIDFEEELYDYTNINQNYFRTSGFGTEVGGWALFDISNSLDTQVPGGTTEIQLKIQSQISGALSSNPAQTKEIKLDLMDLNEISEKWEYSRDDSATGTPSRCAFRLKEVYSSVVPTLYFRSYDLSDSLVVSHNTVSNSARFEYSTDEGVTWNPLGTIPNTVGTLVRYTFTTPPGVKIRPSIRES